MTASSISETGSAADQAAVAAVPGRIVAAWTANDAGAFADVFTEDGTMLLPGEYQKGRDGIRSFMAAGFEGPYKGTQVTGAPIDLVFLAADVAAVITYGGVLAPGEDTIPDDRAIRATWVVVKRDGEWQLAVYQNCPAN
jgi:uncharacterized protein (TIGR02246 family)